MPRSRDARIRDMFDAAQLAVRSCANRARRDLDTDPVLYAATTRWIEIIGEAAKHIDPAEREALGQFPWDQIVGMRNIMAHGYYDVNRDILWRTIQDSLPPLIESLRTYLGDEAP